MLKRRLFKVAFSCRYSHDTHDKCQLRKQALNPEPLHLKPKPYTLNRSRDFPTSLLCRPTVHESLDYPIGRTPRPDAAFTAWSKVAVMFSSYSDETCCARLPALEGPCKHRWRTGPPALQQLRTSGILRRRTHSSLDPLTLLRMASQCCPCSPKLSLQKEGCIM